MILESVDIHGKMAGTLQNLTDEECEMFSDNDLFIKYEDEGEEDGYGLEEIEDRGVDIWKFGEYYIISWNCEGHGVMDTYKIVEE